MRSGMHVTGLFRYPVKSCAGSPVTEARLDARGMEHDRRWMIVDPLGRFLSQREVPRMALVVPTIAGEHLTLRLSGLPDLRLRLHQDGTPCDVEVWDDRLEALDIGDVAAAWCTRALGVPARLVRMTDSSIRMTDPRYAPHPDVPVSFADGYPLLLANEASLEELNARLTVPLPMRRFRPNIVVRGAPAYAEDGWREIRIGGVPVSLVKPCARCAITTVDPDTAERGKEPLRTLATYRRAPSGDVLFCQNGVHGAEGALRVGDLVEVLTTRA